MAHSFESAPTLPPPPRHTPSANTVRMSNYPVTLLFFIPPVHRMDACLFKLKGEGHGVKSMSLVFFQSSFCGRNCMYICNVYDPVQYTVLGIKEHNSIMLVILVYGWRPMACSWLLLIRRKCHSGANGWARYTATYSQPTYVCPHTHRTDVKNVTDLKPI
jgi:hypothetical protein